MEKRASTLRTMIRERFSKKGTLDPRKWMEQENVSELDDLTPAKSSDSEMDSGFNDEEMCKCVATRKGGKIVLFLQQDVNVC